jgi:hypothetical protein
MPVKADREKSRGLYLCNVTVKAKKSTSKNTVKFKFEVIK